MKTTVIGVLLILSLGLTGCKTVHLHSSWTDQPPRIDGQFNDWDSARFQDLTDRGMQVMTMNDGQYLYLAARITDREMSRFLAMFGLILWIDPHGGERKQVELRIPAAAATNFDPARGGFRESLTPEQQTSVDSQLDSLRNGVMVQNSTDEQYKVVPADGMKFQVGVRQGSDGGAQYELRLPLSYQAPFLSYHLPARARTLGLGFGVTSVRSMEEEPGSMAGGVFGEMRGRRSFMANEEVWSEVTLAQR